GAGAHGWAAGRLGFGLGPGGIVDRHEAFFGPIDVIQLDKLVAELVIGLASKVAEREELIFGTFEDLSDGHEAAALEAVVGANRELKVFDGRVPACVSRAFGARGSASAFSARPCD